MKKRIAYLLVLVLLVTLFPGFSTKTQAAATEITLKEISRPNEIDENKNSDIGILYSKEKDMGETLYTFTVNERGWMILDFNGQYVFHWPSGSYRDYDHIFRNASLTSEVFDIRKTHTDTYHGRFFYYIEPGTYYLKNSCNDQNVTYGYFMPDTAAISHKLVKDKDNNGYTDTITFTPHLGSTYLRPGIVAVTDINNDWYDASTNADDVYHITDNGEYTIKAVFTDTEWKDFPVMYSFSVYDIGKGTKDDKTKDDSKTADAKLNVTSKTIKVGETFKLKMTGTKVVSFKSSKKSVAKVSSSGKVTGKKKGSATIKVTCENGETYTCKVKVEKK